MSGVATEHPEYTKRLPQWIRCRDAIAGQDAVHAKGITYLPKLNDQSDPDYDAYKKRALFYNATKRTVSGLVGMLFRKPPNKEAPESLDAVLEDVDLCGKPFDVFAQKVAEECISVGRVGVLVDYPKRPENTVVTLKVAEEMNLRPTMKIYETETIINWRFESIANVWTLVMVVLQEEHEIPEDEFSHKSETRWRVLDLFEGFYRVRLFRKNERGDDELVGQPEFPQQNNAAMRSIPFFVMTPAGVSFEIKEPPLIDLVNVNLSHYKTTADYEHGCHFTALPTLFLAGYQAPVVANGAAPPKIYLGSQEAITQSNKDATAKFIEFSGLGLTSIEKNLDRKESQMAILGARMLAPEKKQAETATTSAIHRAGEGSVLSAISIAVSIGLGKALTIFADWAGAAQKCVYKLNRDFLPLNIDGTTLTSYVQAWQAGAINEEEFFDLLQRGDIVDADLTIEDHKSGEFQEPIEAKKLPGKPGVPATGKIT